MGSEVLSSQLSKKAAKRLAKIGMKKTRRSEIRKRKKMEKKSREVNKTIEKTSFEVSKRDRLRLEKEKLRNSLLAKPNVVIDCHYEIHMTDKEINKTRMQILLCYSLLKTQDKIFHLHLGNFKIQSKLQDMFVEKTPGFSNMSITKFENSVFEYFDRKTIIYLTPDSENVLSEITEDSVYVIGGFVDDHIQRYRSYNRCKTLKVATARLPIAENFRNVNHKQEVLTINQVFAVLLSVHNNVSWKDALIKVLPTRKGYILKETANDKNGP